MKHKFIWYISLEKKVSVRYHGLYNMDQHRLLTSSRYMTNFQSNIMINVYRDVENNMKWKSGQRYPKSLAITDFGRLTSIRISEHMGGSGTSGWAPPEQWLGQFMKW